MTIRERSELSLIGYMGKVIVPRCAQVLANSFKEAVPFFYNVIFILALPLVIPLSAYKGRRDDRKVVRAQDARKAKR